MSASNDELGSGLDFIYRANGTIGRSSCVPCANEQRASSLVPPAHKALLPAVDIPAQKCAVINSEHGIDVGTLHVKMRRRMLFCENMNLQALHAGDELLDFVERSVDPNGVAATQQIRENVS